MRSRILFNLFLLLIVIGLGALYVMQPKETTEEPEPVSNINVDDIRTIRIERPDTETIKLQKTGDDWRLVDPLQTDAEDGRVASILLLPQSASKSRFTATDQKLEKFGLSPAQLTLHFDDETFVIGDASPLAQAYQRMNSPLEIAQSVLYLVSDAAEMVTGTCIAIDGGKSLGVPPKRK